MAKCPQKVAKCSYCTICSQFCKSISSGLGDLGSGAPRGRSLENRTFWPNRLVLKSGIFAKKGPRLGVFGGSRKCTRLICGFWELGLLGSLFWSGPGKKGPGAAPLFGGPGFGRLGLGVFLLVWKSNTGIFPDLKVRTPAWRSV